MSDNDNQRPMTREEKHARINELQHAMQTGVAQMLSLGDDLGDPKHLKVGTNSAMVEHSALASLLMKKGLITLDEYMDAQIEFWENEVKLWTDLVSKKMGGTKVTLL